MARSNSMKFQIKTLIDVTQTNARKGQDKKLVNQQDNFNTLYNTIGLRTNPTEFNISVNKETCESFGDVYKSKHNVWTINFVVEQEFSTSIDFMLQDFKYVPIISGLDETVSIDNDMFITCKNLSKCNIIFNQLDK
jgi:hypothetical protein